ncbi:MAG: IS1595 family transposase [Chloroflexi bacterium]|nr:IS1595 family transposase [Chloroflexota bacterium]
MFEKSYAGLYELTEAFPDEESCVRHLEALRWPLGVICPHCGASRKIYRLKRGSRYRCADCKQDFSVRKGTIFEESRLPLRKWFIAAWSLTSNRKGIPSTQLARTLGVTQKTAWFMLARLREVAGQMTGHGGPVSGETEVDETFLGGKERNKHASKRGMAGKQAVIGARSREGRVRAEAIDGRDRAELHGFIREHVAPGSIVFTDDWRAYQGLTDYHHETVNHSVGEYVRGQAHTQGIESFWAMVKRAYIGVFHHFTWKHLHRYLREFEARWNLGNGSESRRMDTLLSYSSGIRLTYKQLIA